MTTSEEPPLQQQTTQQQEEKQTFPLICSQHLFTFECKTSNCCASYNQRFLMLLFSLVIFIIALIIFILMMINIQWRPFNWKQKTNKRISEVELKSFEETKYLRRMSELNPNIRRETGE